MAVVDYIPQDVEDIPSLVVAINHTIDEINQDLNSQNSSSTLQVAATNNIQQTFEGNAFDYSNPTIDVYSFLDPLFAAIRQAQSMILQGQIQVNAIGIPQLQDGAVTAGAIAPLSVYTGALQIGAVTANQIAADSIVAGKIAANAVATANIQAGAITTTQIASATIVAGNIAAGTITGANIAAYTITASNLNVSILSAITANLGTITAGNITLDSSGYIRGGATSYNSGTGFWMGYDTSAYKFYIGSSTNYLTWNGTILSIKGSIILSSVVTSGAGLYIGSDFLGYYSGSAWTSYLDASGNFYLGGTGGNLQWNAGASTLIITGNTTIGGSSVFSGTVSIGSGVNTFSSSSSGTRFGPSSGSDSNFRFDNSVGSIGLTLYSGSSLSVPGGLVQSLCSSAGGFLFLQLSGGITCQGNISTTANLSCNSFSVSGSAQLSGQTTISDFYGGSSVLTTFHTSFANGGVLMFTNASWSAGCGYANIEARDMGSYNGALYLRTTRAGGGPGATPSDSLIIDPDGLLHWGVFTSGAPTANGYILGYDLAGNVRKFLCG